MNIYSLKVGAEPVPGYKHEPPQTKPHILLHYCTFKVKKTKQTKKENTEKLKKQRQKNGATNLLDFCTFKVKTYQMYLVSSVLIHDLYQT